MLIFHKYSTFIEKLTDTRKDIQMVAVPVAETIRQAVGREEDEKVRESMLYLADQLVKHMPDATIEFVREGQLTEVEHWYAVVEHLSRIRDTGDSKIHPAIAHILELAQPHVSLTR